MSRKKISAIILAAEQNQKPLLPLGSKCALDLLLDQLLELELEEIQIVSGFDSHLLRDHMAKFPRQHVKISNNSLYALGKFRSIKSGVKNLQKPTDGLLITTVELQQIPTNTFKILCETFHTDQRHGLFQSTQKSIQSKLALIDKKYFREILDMFPTNENRHFGINYFFEKYPQDVLNISVKDPY